ncbi:hypothetical protein HMPREF3201_00920 [Megasphaera sp. MJR8396C]|nr:hypothetical protein HMPREF3201_00920 [Megasphaera sp. MJR8396C]
MCSTEKQPLRPCRGPLHDGELSASSDRKVVFRTSFPITVLLW